MIRRGRVRTDPQAAGEESDRLHSEPPNDPAQHVTTERLKQQFEDRLAARLRRRRGR